MGHPRPSPADIVEFEIDSACHMEKMTSYIQNNSRPAPGILLRVRVPPVA